MMRAALLCIILAAAGCRCGQSRPAEHDEGGEIAAWGSDLDDRIRRVVSSLGPSASASIDERMRIHHVPGTSVAVIDAGVLEWARGYGVTEAGSGRRVGTHTLFQAASISKPVSAAAALRLVEQGKLDPDEDVNDRLSSWKVPQNAHTRVQKVTLRRILGHRAGLTVHGFEGYTRDGQWPTLVQVLDGSGPSNSDPVRVDTLPGSVTRYSGGGYCVLEQLLEDVTGKPFASLARDLVLEPVGMERSTFEQPLALAHHSWASSGHHGDGTPVRGRWRVHPERAAAGLWTTPTDLALFVLAIMESLTGNEDALLEGRTAREMAAGLGFMAAGSGGSAHLFHGGANVGFRCFMIAFPGRGQGAVIMTNSESGESLIDEILRSVSAEYGWPARVD